MKGRKQNMAEHAVSLYTKNWSFLPASELDPDKVQGEHEKSIGDRCHIYLICRHPTISFAPETFSFDGDSISGHFRYRVGGESSDLPFLHKFRLLDDAVSVELSKFPHSEVLSVTSAGDVVRRLPANMLCLAKQFYSQRPELGKFEVLYVGQAFGNDGKKSAIDRLRNHSSLQRILAQSHKEDPDQEVFLFPFEYAQYHVITHIHSALSRTLDVELERNRFYSINENPLTERQQICLAEAALIRYFRPTFNKDYKLTFPQKNHKILEECYELDFSALAVEINADDFGFVLFSDEVEPSGHHISKIDLFAREERRSFFSFPSEGGGELEW